MNNKKLGRWMFYLALFSFVVSFAALVFSIHSLILTKKAVEKEPDFTFYSIDGRNTLSYDVSVHSILVVYNNGYVPLVFDNMAHVDLTCIFANGTKVVTERVGRYYLSEEGQTHLLNRELDRSTVLPVDDFLFYQLQKNDRLPIYRNVSIGYDYCVLNSTLKSFYPFLSKQTPDLRLIPDN